MADLAKSLTCEIKDVNACRKEFRIAAGADVVKKQAARALNDIAGMVSLPGFRAGKAPVGIVRTRYEKEIREEVERRMVNAAFDLINEHREWEILSVAFAEEPTLELDKDFSFVMNVDIAPEIKLPDYKAIKIDAPEVKVDEKALAERMDFYRNMYSAYAEAEDAAKAGDMLKVTYKSDFALPEDASASLKRIVEAEDSYLWLNDPEMIPGSTKALTGAEKGKHYQFSAEYPAGFRETALAGKKVVYDLDVLSIQRRKPLTDEELCEKLQVKSVQDFEKNLRDAMTAEEKNKQRGELAEKLYAEIDAKVPEFELPPALLQSESAKELRKIANEQIKNAEDAEKFKAAMEENTKAAGEAARKSLRRSMILRGIAKAENISITADEVNAQIDSMSRYYGYKGKEFRSMLEKNGAIDELALDMVNAKTLEFLTGLAVSPAPSEK